MSVRLSIGVELLRTMGWKEGQGVGPRVKRKPCRQQTSMSTFTLLHVTECWKDPAVEVLVTVIQWYSHTVIQTYCRTVELSYCNTVIQLYSHTVMPSYSHTDILSYSHIVVKSYSHKVVQLYSLIVIQSYHCTVIRSYSRTVIQSYCQTVIKPYSCAVIASYRNTQRLNRLHSLKCTICTSSAAMSLKTEKSCCENIWSLMAATCEGGGFTSKQQLWEVILTACKENQAETLKLTC